MQLTINSPSGPRPAVSPSLGIANEEILVKSLIMTLAVEANRGADFVTLDVDLVGADPALLVGMAKQFVERRCSALGTSGPNT
jgi:hypothetical protein